MWVGAHNACCITDCWSLIGFQVTVVQNFAYDVGEYCFLYGTEVWYYNCARSMEREGQFLCLLSE